MWIIGPRTGFHRNRRDWGVEDHISASRPVHLPRHAITRCRLPRKLE